MFEGQFFPKQRVQFSGGPNKVSAALTLSLVTNTTADARSITVPASAQAGDLVVILAYATNFGGTGYPPIGSPAGWTEITHSYFGPSSGGDGHTLYSIYKVIVSGDVSASINVINNVSGVNYSTQLYVFRPTKTIAGVTPSTWLTEITSSNPASQAANASGAGTPVIVLGLAGLRAANPSFSTASPAWTSTTSENVGDTRTITGYVLYNTSPQNHTVDMNDLGFANALMSGYISVT